MSDCSDIKNAGPFDGWWTLGRAFPHLSSSSSWALRGSEYMAPGARGIEEVTETGAAVRSLALVTCGQLLCAQQGCADLLGVCQLHQSLGVTEIDLRIFSRPRHP